mgnify:CR=1 FL=1
MQGVRFLAKEMGRVMGSGLLQVPRIDFRKFSGHSKESKGELKDVYDISKNWCVESLVRNDTVATQYLDKARRNSGKSGLSVSIELSNIFADLEGVISREHRKHMR